ncbi:MAG: sensor histidine kinase, partial [Anaerolineales bacterium]
VGGTTFLEYAGLIPHQTLYGFLPEPLYQQPLYLFGVLGFFSSTAVIVTFLVGTIQNRLRQRETEVIELTESLQRTTRRLQALNDGAKIVGSTLELHQVLERMVETTAKAMEVRACSIRMLDKSGRFLEPVAVYGLSQTYINKGPVDALTNLLARETLSGKVVNIPNAPESPLLQYPDEARAEGIKSMLSAPLLGKNGPMGILRAYAVEQNRFTKEDEEFISAIAAQGSIAIENAIAYQSMQELDKMKSQFIHMVTHELRSPVSVTKSLLRTITAGYAGDLNEQQRDILDRATRRIEYLQKLVDDLLDLAAGKAQPKLLEKPAPTELVAIIHKVLARYEIPAKEKAISLEFINQCQCDEIKVCATPEGVDRILNNLLSNAVKYTLNNGKVTVSLDRLDGEIHIAVQDTGIGIPEEALPHLFQEFYRAPNAKAIEMEGTGLGLSIIKDIIERFGGRITVESKLGEGTTFHVFLPLARST